MSTISEDPELEATERLYEWKNTPMGQYVFARCRGRPEYRHYLDPDRLCYNFSIVAELEEKYITEYYLKWGKP